MEKTIPIDDPPRRGALYGTADRNLRLIRAAFDVRISARNNSVHINGPADAVQNAVEVIENLQRCLSQNPVITDEQVREAIRQVKVNGADASRTSLGVFLPSVTIAPRSAGQRAYVEAIQENDLTFCLGPAGTGKTYLAVALAVSLLKQAKIKRIMLVRPAVEAGEKLGYLPGDLQAKVNPYLRPLFDAMHDMMTFDQTRRFMQNDVIEVVPLAFMRGRTLNQAVIILDEAQNATASQMLMFLTRLGQHSKMIVTGDDSQSDLESGEPRGLLDAVARLEGITGVGVVRLTRTDIVRHPLVQQVVEAYGQDGPRDR
ncbi:MAG: PhoH family protein [Phycisphaerales bacterium]|nr:MAG: PhoH family protein [Phycisphaerales bacterium]